MAASIHPTDAERRFNRRWGLISLASLILGAGLTWLSFATGWPGV